MRQIAEFVAVLSCALFTGAAVYITFIEHPARMQCGVKIAATEFVPSYRRATVMQATCAALGLLASVGAWLAGAPFSWLVGGVLLGSVIPFTLIAILPTNKRLLSPTLGVIQKSIQILFLSASLIVVEIISPTLISRDFECCGLFTKITRHLV